MIQIHNQQKNEYVSMQKWVYPPALVFSRKQHLNGLTIDSVYAEESVSRWAHYWMIGHSIALQTRKSHLLQVIVNRPAVTLRQPSLAWDVFFLITGVHIDIL